MPVGHLNFFFGEVSVHILRPFFSSVICFLGVEACEFFIYFGCVGYIIYKYISHTVGCLFVLLMVSFAVQKLLRLM